MATFTGGPGNDTILGTPDNDTIDGGPGNDTITGGAGVDTLTGGTGADTFMDTAAGLNGDTITDFLPGDRIQITDLSLATANIQLVGNTITYGSGATAGTITIGDGISAGRYVIRALGNTGGVEIHFQQDAHNDFNGDGHSDILWRTDDGTMTDWLGQADGTLAFNPGSYNATVPASVHIVGTGDFNGDGRVDILWRAADGTITDWLGQADGSFKFNPASYNSTVPASVHIVGIGDFNGDGRSDILWRTDDGTMTDWLGHSDGSFAFNPASYTTSVPPSVHIQSPFVHDGLV
jgi:hypothetical protein